MHPKTCQKQARGVAEGVIAAVSLMAESGLPCFGRGRPVENLRARFHLELSDSQAAAFMRRTIADAYDKVTPHDTCRACPGPPSPSEQGNLNQH